MKGFSELIEPRTEVAFVTNAWIESVEVQKSYSPT
jgi:hypothetical protein